MLKREIKSLENLTDESIYTISYKKTDTWPSRKPPDLLQIDAATDSLHISRTEENLALELESPNDTDQHESNGALQPSNVAITDDADVATLETGAAVSVNGEVQNIYTMSEELPPTAIVGVPMRRKDSIIPTMTADQPSVSIGHPDKQDSEDRDIYTTQRNLLLLGAALFLSSCALFALSITKTFMLSNFRGLFGYPTVIFGYLSALVCFVLGRFQDKTNAFLAIILGLGTMIFSGVGLVFNSTVVEDPGPEILTTGYTSNQHYSVVVASLFFHLVMLLGSVGQIVIPVKLLRRMKMSGEC